MDAWRHSASSPLPSPPSPGPGALDTCQRACEPLVWPLWSAHPRKDHASLHPPTQPNGPASLPSSLLLLLSSSQIVLTQRGRRGEDAITSCAAAVAGGRTEIIFQREGGTRGSSSFHKPWGKGKEEEEEEDARPTLRSPTHPSSPAQLTHPTHPPIHRLFVRRLTATYPTRPAQLSPAFAEERPQCETRQGTKGSTHRETRHLHRGEGRKTAVPFA